MLKFNQLTYSKNLSNSKNFIENPKNIYEKNIKDIGSWGGSCRCPNGKVYQVGDNNDDCKSLACIGGKSGVCKKTTGPWSKNKVTCANKKKYIQDISNKKINNFNEFEYIYNKNTSKILNLHNEQLKSNIIIDKQNNQFNSNMNKINNIKSKIQTLKRQIEISKEFTNFNNIKIFLFKTTLVYLILLIIPIMLYKNKTINKNYTYIIIFCLSFIYFSHLLSFIYNLNNRNNLDINNIKWNKHKLDQ